MKDTSDYAAALQADIHRRMSAAERFRIALDMSLMAQELAAARLRSDHPDWNETDVTRELLRIACLADDGRRPR